MQNDRRIYANITGWGKYTPERVLTNEELAVMVDTSDEWIQSRSGIRERRMVGPDEHTSTMAVGAAQQALERAGLAAEDVDLILVATSSPDYLTPPISSMVQHELGANRAGAMTIVVGCTGFVYSLITAQQFITSGAARNVLVIGAELITRNLDWTDRNTCVLFGDGAGAVVMQATDEPAGVMAHVLGSNGAGAEHLIQYGGGARIPASNESLEQRLHFLRMNGREVFKFATSTMVEALRQVMEQADITPDDIDLFIPHQANARIIEYAAQTAGIASEKVVVNVDRYGNTSAASVPIALCEAFESGRAKPGDTLALVAFGAGLTWAACVFQLAGGAVDSPASEPSHAVEGWIA